MAKRKPKKKEEPKIKLNLGAGDTQIKGFIPIDRKFGQEVYPLEYEDNSVDEIRASHVLEHFAGGAVDEVLRHWVAKLKPGGILKVAVPNFEWIAENYLAGSQINTTGYIMGGQTDENDFHYTLFDKDTLAAKMLAAGLKDLWFWKSEIQDCASLPVSLNIQGKKVDPAKVQAKRQTKIAAVMSIPRLAFTDNFFSAIKAILPLGIPLEKGSGVFWGQVLQNLMESHLDDGTDLILTLDYDTWFTRNHVLKLIEIMMDNPEVDAAIPVQMRRDGVIPLCGVDGPKGAKEIHVPVKMFKTDLTPVKTGHFGLTMFRVSSLRKMKLPWFHAEPNKEGKWGEGHMDADIAFWNKFTRTGLKPYLCNDVFIGHLQMVCSFAGKPENNWQPFHVYMNDLEKNGPPPHCEPGITVKG